MKKPLLHKLQRCIVLPAALLLCVGSASVADAQSFNPASSPEYTYPGPGFITTTTHSFTYTMGHIAYMSNVPKPAPPPPVPPYSPAPPTVPLTDLTVHSWDDPGGMSGFSYVSKATGSGTPGIIYDQGTINYPAGVQDIELSLMQDEMGYNMFMNGTNANWFVVVSYYNPAGSGGPGHYMDVYTWNRPAPWGPGGLTLNYTTQLSTLGSFTRISQDSHNTYGLCITWEDPNAGSPTYGINFVFGFMVIGIPGVSISPTYTLAGTGGETHPDVAFTHATGLDLQFLYYKKTGGHIYITESTIPMQTGSWSTPPAPTIKDVNVVPGYFDCALPDLKTRIDAPDHGGVDNWAYSYILPVNTCVSPTNKDIYVRYMNYNAPNYGVPATYILTNGSMGNAPIDIGPSGYNDWPVCSFDQTTSLLNVEWYTQYQPGFFGANTGGYTGIQMNETGALTSATDYLQIADAPSNQYASSTPTIASSRQNDRTDYQHPVFANFDPTGLGNVMQIKDRTWGSPSFKGAQPANNWAGLYNTTATNSPSKGQTTITAYPNPFQDQLSLNISAGLAGKSIAVSVEDVAGRVLGEFTGAGADVNTSLSALTAKLGNGTYLIKVSTTSGDWNKVLKVQKIAE